MYRMTEIEVVKQKRGKQNISDEERERRRQRMLALREKLDKASKPVPKKDTKSAIEAKKAEFVKAEAEKIRKQQEEKKKLEPIVEEKKEEAVKQPAEPKKRNYKTPARVVDSDSEDEPAPKKKTAMRKPPVKKAIKIKYYGDVSVQEMENDAKFLQGLHQVDKTYEAPKKEAPKDEKMERMLREMGY